MHVVNEKQVQYASKIQQALHDGQLAIIIGAGVSLGATDPAPQRITSIGLVRNGLDYLPQKTFVTADDIHLKFYRRTVEKDTASIGEVSRAFKYLKDILEHENQFSAWLESVFGNLRDEVRHPEIFEALSRFHKRGAKLMTSNYDDLLESFCGLQRVRWSIANHVRDYERGTLDGVFHIHGSYHDPADVVFDSIDYFEAETSENVKNLLSTYLEYNTILFVGCGSEREGPNFNTLLSWASNKMANIPNHHYVLLRHGDTVQYNSLTTLGYGHSYSDLVPFLNTLPGEQGSGPSPLNQPTIDQGRYKAVEVVIADDGTFVGGDEKTAGDLVVDLLERPIEQRYVRVRSSITPQEERDYQLRAPDSYMRLREDLRLYTVALQFLLREGIHYYRAFQVTDLDKAVIELRFLALPGLGEYERWYVWPVEAPNRVLNVRFPATTGDFVRSGYYGKTTPRVRGMPQGRPIWLT
ncbi:uncharacterized protein EI97DRAFT_237428 [Westerdykella ornata]|uniref:Uncharacterized protein n=1 Tax=Westerdykella ornata TaxID=318751 RepID=A0A6A6J9Z9_WESOR|nr:uncharacterized protein EI97DRAFT_237428 [Westerdykella ornata]KAF2272039.1 hypothetical protein EI97DRAFT_237428 [Westerdykella ornata]